MSDAWKIVQGLKRQAQNDSFGKNHYVETGRPIEYKPRKLTPSELRDKEWRELDSDIVFTPFSPDEPDYDPNLEKYNVEQIKSFIKECKEQNKPLSMRIGELKIDISSSNPEQVTFTSDGRLSSGASISRNSYPYSITINGDKIFSQLELVDIERRATYRLSEKNSIPVKIRQQIDIINAQDTTEKFIVVPKQDEYDISENLSEYISQNNEFQIENGNELVRDVIDPTEKIRKLYYEYRDEALKQYISSENPNKYENLPTGFYETYYDCVDNNEFGQKKINENLHTYEDGVEIAKGIEEHCKYIYSLIMEATKGTHQQLKSNESEQSADNINENDVSKKEHPEEQVSDYNVDVENLNDEELDALIEKMENLQKEKQSKIERLQKIKRAQDLISLSKDQDKIIADLESQIEIEGVDLGEK